MYMSYSLELNMQLPTNPTGATASAEPVRRNCIHVQWGNIVAILKFVMQDELSARLAQLRNSWSCWYPFELLLCLWTTTFYSQCQCMLLWCTVAKCTFVIKCSNLCMYMDVHKITHGAKIHIYWTPSLPQEHFFYSVTYQDHPGC